MMSKEMDNRQLWLKVTLLLQQLGVPAHLSGYYYLRSAIMISYQESNSVSSVTKLLYPEIAKDFDTTQQKVERGIRNAIEVGWKNGNPDFFQKEFGYATGTKSRRPSNSEYIARIVDYIRMKELEREMPDIAREMGIKPAVLPAHSGY